MQLYKVTVGDEMVRTNLLTVEDLGTPHARKLKVPGNPRCTVNGLSLSADLPGVFV
jgi:hypothetical protein